MHQSTEERKQTDPVFHYCDFGTYKPITRQHDNCQLTSQFTIQKISIQSFMHVYVQGNCTIYQTMKLSNNEHFSKKKGPRSMIPKKNQQVLEQNCVQQCSRYGNSVPSPFVPFELEEYWQHQAFFPCSANLSKYCM